MPASTYSPMDFAIRRNFNLPSYGSDDFKNEKEGPYSDQHYSINRVVCKVLLSSKKHYNYKYASH